MSHAPIDGSTAGAPDLTATRSPTRTQSFAMPTYAACEYDAERDRWSRPKAGGGSCPFQAPAHRALEKAVVSLPPSGSYANGERAAYGCWSREVRGVTTPVNRLAQCYFDFMCYVLAVLCAASVSVSDNPCVGSPFAPILHPCLPSLVLLTCICLESHGVS